MTDQSIPLPVLPARVSPGRAYFQCRNTRSKAGQDRKGKGKQRAYDPDESKSYSGLSFDAIYAGLEHSTVLKKLQQRTATFDSQRYSPPSQDVETVLYIEKDQSEATTHAGITEELAWSGSTLVWSKGSSIYRTHTFSEDADDKHHVVQALFAFFEVPAPPRADGLPDSSLPPEQRPTSPPSLVPDNGSSTSTDSNDDLYGPFHPRTPPPAWSDDNATASISQEAASTLTSVQQVRVLVVLLQEELRLYYPGGQLHIVPLSFPVSKIWAMERGLLLEKQTGAMKSTPHWLSGLSGTASSSTQSLPEPVFYSIIDPYEDAKPLTKVPDLLNIPAAKPLDPLKARQEAKTTRMTEAAVFCEDDERIVFISDRRDSSDPILLTMNCKTAKLSIWAYTTLVRDPMEEITAFRQLMKDEATAHHLNDMQSDRTLDLGSTSLRLPHATLGKRRRSSDEQSMHLPSSELDLPGFTAEHNTSHRPAGSTATQRRVSALLERRKSQHNPNATVSELLGGLAPAGLPLSGTSNGVSQDKQHRRTSLLKAATSAGMDRRSSTTRNELSVSLDRMAIGATNSHVHPHTLSQHTQLPALSQTPGMSVEPGQLASHEKQERLEAIVGNGDMERETSLRVSPHINKEPESDIYITRLYRTEVPGISSVTLILNSPS